MVTNLEARTIDSNSVLITEHNSAKRKYPELYGDTPTEVREAIEKGKISEIPPIVALQNPFQSIDRTIEAYQQYTQAIPRQGEGHYEHEDAVLREILQQNSLLCYNGNRRLEEFQRAIIPIRAFVIASQEEYTQKPEQERRIPERLKAKMPAKCQLPTG